MTREEGAAIVEAILFTMGDSVEISALAKAIDTDVKEVKGFIEYLKEKYEKNDSGIGIVELEKAVQLCTSRRAGRCLYSSGCRRRRWCRRRSRCRLRAGCTGQPAAPGSSLPLPKRGEGGGGKSRERIAKNKSISLWVVIMFYFTSQPAAFAIFFGISVLSKRPWNCSAPTPIAKAGT